MQNLSFRFILLLGLLVGAAFSAGCQRNESSPVPENTVSALSMMAPGLSLNQDSYVLYERLPSQAIMPRNVGGDVSSCTIAPEIPPGLIFSELDCSIRGTPSQQSEEVAYRVIAINKHGESTATIKLKVDRGPLLGLLNTTFVSGGEIKHFPLTGAASNPFSQSLISMKDGSFLFGFRENSTQQDQEFLKFDASGAPIAPSLNDLSQTCLALFQSGCILGASHRQSDGKILIGYLAQTSQKIKILRYLEDGRLDTSFAGTGIFTLNWYSGLSAPLKIQSFGNKVVVLAEVVSAGALGYSSVVFRIKEDGIIDSSFGSSGVTFMNNLTRAHGMAIHPTLGDLFVSGRASGTQIRDVVQKIKGNGRLDSAFGTNSLASLQDIDSSVPGSGNEWSDIVLDSPRNRLVVASTSRLTASESESQLRLFSLDLMGKLRKDFAGQSSAQMELASGTSRLVGAQLRIDFWGQLYFLGNWQEIANGASAPSSHSMLARFKVDGALDTSFGVDGIFAGAVGQNSELRQMELLPSGDLIIAGFQSSYASSEPTPGVYQHTPSFTGLVQIID